MKFFAVVPALLAAVSAEAQILTGAGLYSGYHPVAGALPYAAAYSAPVSAQVDARFAYGAPITALNSLPAAAPAVASYAALPAVQAVPAVRAVPAVAAAPVAGPVSSQYQAQDENGNIAYGYQNINSAKQESGNAYGGVTGSYTYQDEAGVHTVNYVADALGFRVSADNLPVGPASLAVAPVHVAQPVVDTPEVVEAKAAFFKAYDAAKSGITKRSAQIPLNYATYAAAPAFAAPLSYAASPAISTHALNYAAAPAIAAPAITANPLSYAAAPAITAPLSYAAAPALATHAVNYAAAPAISAPLSYAAAPAIASPALTYGAPAREAVLTTIKLNPGHAVSYRVD